MAAPPSHRSGTCGGSAIFWESSVIGLATHMAGRFSITARATMLHSSSGFWLTTVYGPADEARKDDFLQELAAAAPPPGQPWLIYGDFNIIYEARDKNNAITNRRIMGIFRSAIDRAELREIK